MLARSEKMIRISVLSLVISVKLVVYYQYTLLIGLRLKVKSKTVNLSVDKHCNTSNQAITFTLYNKLLVIDFAVSEDFNTCIFQND